MEGEDTNQEKGREPLALPLKGGGFELYGSTKEVIPHRNVEAFFELSVRNTR
jgi:hypothetical protein